MAQFNQLINSASAIVQPPDGYIALLYDENYSLRLFNYTGEITPTSSQASWTASFALQANGFTTGSKRILGSLSMDANLTVSGSAYVSKSLGVLGTVSASQFSGSGADLYDISASAILGLNLSRMATGSVTASVDVNNGFVVNSTVSGSTFSGSVKVVSGSYSGSGANLSNIPASAIVGLNLSTISTGSFTASLNEVGILNTNAALYVSNSTAARSYEGTASIKTDGGVVVKGDAYFSSSVFVRGNLTILGTQSVEYITSSQLDFGDNIINLNTSTNALRFGGIAVLDSGSTESGNSGSFLWDSLNNQWISDVTLAGTRTSTAFIGGPQNTGALGSEIGLTQFSIPVGQGASRITSSMLTVSASALRVPMNSIIGNSVTQTQSLTGSVGVTGSFTVFARNNPEFRVVETGVTIGNVITDNHLVTGSFGVTGSLNTVGNITATGDLISAKSIGNEGGEILLAKSQTNTTIAGTGIIIDSFKNTLRIYEQGGTLRGGFYDITQLSGSVNTNLYGDQATYLHAKKSGTQVVSSGGAPIIAGYATPTISINAAEWNGTTGIFTATKAGTYMVTAQVQYASNIYTGGTALSIRVMLNGVEQNGANWFSFDQGYVGVPSTVQCSAIVTVLPTNELYAVTFNGNNAAKTVQASGTAITIQELPTRVLK